MRKTRREFLTDSAKSALMLTALDTVFGSLLHSHLNVYAATSPFKNFLHINLWQAPPRWQYDLFLNPSGLAADIMTSPMVSNVYKGTNQYTGAQYRLVKHLESGYYIPHLWSQSVPLSSGRTVKAASLLDNMMSIRGIDVINAGHQGAAHFHEAAIVGSPTLGSVTAELALNSEADPVQNMIRAMNIDPMSGSLFKSKNGIPSFQFNTSIRSNNLSTLFGTFKPIAPVNFNPLFAKNFVAMQDQIRAALKSLSPNAKAYYASLTDNSDRSLSILTSNTVDIFSDLTVDWNNLFGKYQKLITDTMAGTYESINDRRIGEVKSGADALPYQFRASNPVFTTDENGNVDLRRMTSNANLDRLAAQFAVVEFLMVHKICPSISFSPEGFLNLMVNSSTERMNFDQHNTGYMPGIYLNSMFFLCLTSCTLELISVLKNKNLFNDTLIYLAGEFNRSALFDGRGSDHGEKAGSISLISGRINKFKLIGNIYRDSAGPGTISAAKYRGTWGYSAPIGATKEVPLNIVQAWASVMVLLGMPISEVPNAVDKGRLIFNSAGSFAIGTEYNLAPRNIKNG